jgi:hypothetical protein
MQFTYLGSVSDLRDTVWGLGEKDPRLPA